MGPVFLSLSKFDTNLLFEPEKVSLGHLCSQHVANSNLSAVFQPDFLQCVTEHVVQSWQFNFSFGVLFDRNHLLKLSALFKVSLSATTLRISYLYRSKQLLGFIFLCFGLYLH